MSLNPLAAGVGGLVVVFSLWFADHAYQVQKQAMQANSDFAAQNGVLSARVDELALALRERAAVMVVLSDMSIRLSQTQSTLVGQTAQLNRSLLELKRSDEKVTAYLAGPVPGALGLRYVRAETTDPVEYRASAAGVRVEPVPSPSPSGADR